MTWSCFVYCSNIILDQWDTQLPRGFLVSSLLPQSHIHLITLNMLPLHWHLVLEYISFASTLVAILQCARKRRWYPTPSAAATTTTPSLWFTQFRVYLLIHSAFYIVELLVSHMYRLYVGMAWHHIIVNIY